MDRGYFEDLLDQLEPAALAMDRTGDSAHVHLLFRQVHNLKSSVAQEGLTGLSTEVHHLEDTLDRIRRGRETWAPEHYDLVMAMVDKIRQTLVAAGGEEPTAGAEAAPAVPARVPAPVSAPAPAATAYGLPLSAPEAAAVGLAETLGQGIYRIEKLFKRGLDRETFTELPVMEDVRELGTLIAVHPGWEAYDQGPEEQVIRILFVSSRTAAELEEILFDPLITLKAPRSLAPAAPAAPRDTLRILIVEDDQTTGHLLQYILRQHGHCQVRETGEAALAAFREQWRLGEPYDLMVLDIFLPDSHGYDVLKEIRGFEEQRGIRSVAEHCQVLINTASTDLDEMRHMLELEPDGYLIKPINMDLIIGKLLDLKAARLG
jgi:CheY-like chemotaxis protein